MSKEPGEHLVLEELACAYLSGTTFRELTERFGYSKAQLWRILNKNNIRRPKPVVVEDKEVSRLYSVHGTVQKVAALTGMSRTSVTRSLRRGGIRPVGTNNRKHSLQEDFFTDIISEEQAYWLGFLLADGAVTYSKDPSGNKRTNSGVMLGLAIRDRGHVEKFRQAISSSSPIMVLKPGRTGRSTGDSARVHIYSKRLVEDLISWGVTPRKSASASVPHNAFKGDLERHFWRGVMDGDGSIYWDHRHEKGGLNLAGSRSVCESFSSWVESLTGRTYTVRSTASASMFTVTVTSFAAFREVAKALYEDTTISLDRKQETYAVIRSRLEAKNRWDGYDGNSNPRTCKE